MHPIAKTFKKRSTTLPTSRVLVFTSEFFDNEEKMKQWAAFCNKNRTYVAETSLEALCREIAEFVMPILKGLQQSEQFQMNWPAGGPWR